MEKIQGARQIGKHIRNVGRLAQIVNILAKHGFWSLLEASQVKSWLTEEQVRQAEEISRSKESNEDTEPVQNGKGERRLGHILGSETGPRRLREALEELGPAFVKLGQLLASREDLISEPFLKELRKLHQDVAALPYSVIQIVLKDELGDRLSQFAEISETPLAAGSIGQVHKATLKDGRRVAIKVQRPNIAEQVRADLTLMELLAGLIEKYVPELRILRPKLTVQEFKRALDGELDFIREAGNTAKIAENFSDHPFVQLPEVFWNLSTTRVLTLSFVEGYSLLEKEALKLANFDLPQLVENGLTMFLQMVFVDGLYHGDLHSGNLLALPGNRIGLLDCGLTVRMSRLTRENLAGLLVSLVEEDYESLVSHFIELADPSHNFNMSDFEEAVANELTPFIGLKLNQVKVGRLLWRLAKISAQHNAPMPRQLILFFKTMSSFEGIGSSLSPDFDVISVCERFSADLVKHMYSKDNLQRQALIIARDVANLARLAPRQVRGLLKQVSDGELQVNVNHRDMQFFASTLDRMFTRIAVSLILSALIVGSSILVLARAGEQYYHLSSLGVVGFAIAGFLGLYVVWSVIRGKPSRF